MTNSSSWSGGRADDRTEEKSLKTRMEGLKEVDENENKEGGLGKLEADVVVAAKDESEEAYKSLESAANANPEGLCGGGAAGLGGLIDDGSSDLGSYWREMGFVWGHQGTAAGTLPHMLEIILDVP